MTPKKPEPPRGLARPCTQVTYPETTAYLGLCPVCHRNYPPGVATCEMDGNRLHRVCVAPGCPQTGQIVGDIELIIRIAPGSCSEVWEGLRSSDGRSVIIKLMRFHTHDMDAVADLCSRFFREAAAVSAIGHPNIVALLDHGLDPSSGQAFLVFEHLAGMTLVSAMRHWRMPRDLALGLNVAVQIAGGMTQVHRLGIIHRDLKPSNIFLESSPAGNRVKILDFGLAKIRNTPYLAALTRDMMYGTPAYLAPEQARGEDPDETTDIYSLGVLLYELFTGKLPFSGKPMNLIQAHLQKLPPDPTRIQPGLPPELARIILRCMEKDKSLRYQSMALLQEALLAVRSLAEISLPT